MKCPKIILISPSCPDFSMVWVLVAWSREIILIAAPSVALIWSLIVVGWAVIIWLLILILSVVSAWHSVVWVRAVLSWRGLVQGCRCLDQCL